MSTQAEGLPSALSRVAFFEQKAKELSGGAERGAASSGDSSSSPQPQEQAKGEGKAPKQAPEQQQQQQQPAGPVGSPLSRPRFNTIVAWRRGVASSSPTAGSVANSSGSNTTSRSGSISNPKQESSSGASSPKPSAQKGVSGGDAARQPQTPQAPAQASQPPTKDPAASRPNPMSIQDRLAVFGGSRERSAPQASGPRRATFSTVATQARKTSAPSAGPVAPKAERASLPPASSSGTTTTTTKVPSAPSSSAFGSASDASAGTSSSASSTTTSTTAASTTAPAMPGAANAPDNSSPTPKRATFSTVPSTPQGAASGDGRPKAVASSTAKALFRKPAASSGISHLLPKDPAVAYLNVTKTAGGSGGSGGSGSSGGADSSRRNTAPQQSLRKSNAGSSNRCSVCSKPVYAMEKVMADGVALHKWCFRCAECNCKVTPGSYASLEGVIYCKPHFKQLFQLRGRYTFNEESAPDVSV